jgi:hypothetical protein
MSDRPRVRRDDPERDAPIRDWSNIFRSPDVPIATVRSADMSAASTQMSNPMPGGVANGCAAASTPAAQPAIISEEARVGIETAYRVIDEHLREGKSAAQAQNGRDGDAGPGVFATSSSAAVDTASASIQEMVTQGIRFYSSLAPLWAKIVNSIANSAVVSAGNGISAAAPTPPNGTSAASPPSIIEIASVRMTRVTVNLTPHAVSANLAIGGLLALDAEKPSLREISLAIEPRSHTLVTRIRVPDSQPPGVYSGVIADSETGEPCGTITLRIEG